MKIVIAFICLFLLTGCSPAKEYDRSFLLMGTVVNVKTQKSQDSKVAVEKAIRKMYELDGVFNRFSTESELCRINNSKSKERIEVSNDIYTLLNLAIELNKKTYGAFDVTIGPLEKAWGFYNKESATHPDMEKIKALLKSTGMNNLLFDKSKKEIQFENAEMELDFSAIAKGYIVDEAIKILRESGIDSALIDAGGDVYCLGKKGKRDWVIGIRDPRNKREILAKLNLSDRAVATSGGYENFIVLDGEKYPHIIDPRTGFPVSNNVISATVIAEDCATADGLSTVFFILNPEQSLDIAEREEEIDCVIIALEKGNLRFIVSSGIEKSLTIIE